MWPTKRILECQCDRQVLKNFFLPGSSDRFLHEIRRRYVHRTWCVALCSITRTTYFIFTNIGKRAELEKLPKSRKVYRFISANDSSWKIPLISDARGKDRLNLFPRATSRVDERREKREIRWSLIIIRWKSDLTFSITDKLAVRVQREMKSCYTNRSRRETSFFSHYGLLTVHYDSPRK